MATVSEPLVDAGFSENSCCRKLTVWRDEGSNRKVWKSICTLCVSAWILFYLYIVRTNQVLILIGLLSLVKFLIEIWGQDTPNWVCPGGPVMFLVVFGMIFPGVVYYTGLCRENPDIFLGPYRGAFGFVLFTFGSGYSLWYEVHRFKWKQDVNNRGKLHTIGLARYCIHPNYFGDLFTFSGWAICTGTTCALSMPLFMIPSFVFVVIPNSDAYLAKRYSQEWLAYEAETATFIPFLRSRALNQLLACASLALGCYWSLNCGTQCG